MEFSQLCILLFLFSLSVEGYGGGSNFNNHSGIDSAINFRDGLSQFAPPTQVATLPPLSTDVRGKGRDGSVTGVSETFDVQTLMNEMLQGRDNTRQAGNAQNQVQGGMPPPAAIVNPTGSQLPPGPQFHDLLNLLKQTPGEIQQPVQNDMRQARNTPHLLIPPTGLQLPSVAQFGHPPLALPHTNPAPVWGTMGPKKSHYMEKMYKALSRVIPIPVPILIPVNE